MKLATPDAKARGVYGVLVLLSLPILPIIIVEIML